jgi:Rad3-related DNA helicase
MILSNCKCNPRKSRSTPTGKWSPRRTVESIDPQQRYEFEKKDHFKDEKQISLAKMSLKRKETRITPSRVKELKNMYNHVEEEIIEEFPFHSPREGQLDIITRLNEAIEQGYPYLILEAGTGTGKSAVATTLARMYQPAYILTMTKQLQAQYAAEFGYPLVKGRGNFACLDSNLDLSCDMGTCQTTPSSQEFSCDYGVTKSPFEGGYAFQDAYGAPIYFRSQDHCPYWEQKAESAESSITLMNYDYALLELNYVKHFGKRQLMILDEAHNLEDKLMRRLEVNLSRQRLEKDVRKTIPRSMMSYKEPVEWILFLESLYDAYSELSVKQMPKNQADRVTSTKLRLSELLNNLEDQPENWVVDTDPAGVSFKPLRVDGYTENRLFQYADTCLFMSATILDKELFSRWLGLEPDEVFYLEVPSPFSAGNRPVHMNLAGKMSQRLIKRTAPKTIPILEKIIKHHKYEKGLIHTHNYKCQHYVMNQLNSSRLIGHNSQNREYALYEFEKTREPRILVSPSMSEGVDLPYEQCQFQVIYKIPFPYLGDPQVNERRKQDPRWYAYKTVITLLQAYGRGMRAEDDYCETYILDGNIRMLLTGKMYRHLIPRYFKEAIVRNG